MDDFLRLLNIERITTVGLMRPLIAVAIGVSMVGVIILSSPMWAPAQTPEDLQRQIQRLQAELDQLDKQLDEQQAENVRIRLSGFERLAAVEREIDLTRRITFGLALPLIGNLLLSGLALRGIVRRNNRYG